MPIRHRHYLYVRTKERVDLADEAIGELVSKLQDLGPLVHEEGERKAGILMVGPNYTPWRDGFVLRFDSRHLAEHIISSIRDELSNMDGWAIHNTHGDFLEYPSLGLLEGFYRQATKNNVVGPIAQLFILGNVNDARYGATIDQIKSRLDGYSRPVFSFADGQVLLLNSDQPS